MHVLWISSGIAVWALHFAVIYGLTALACARGHPHVVPWIIGLAALIAGAIAAGIMMKTYRGRATFTEWMTMSVAALVLIGILYETAAGLLAPLCA